MGGLTICSPYIAHGTLGCVCVWGGRANDFALPVDSAEEAKVFLKGRHVCIVETFQEATTSGLRAAPFYRMTRSCYEKDIDLCSSYKVSGDIYTLLGFRLCWVTPRTHTHKKADFDSFLSFALIFSFPAARSLSRYLPLPDGMPITPVK